MSKKLLNALFGAGLAALVMSPAAFAGDIVSDYHGDSMDGCETCHADGAPSDDGAYELEQCQNCHGGLADMDEMHQAHDGISSCTDCHAVHDQEMGESPACDACHDDGRTAE